MHAHKTVPELATGFFADATVPEDARRSAEQALRLLLEVLDRRRPAEQMGTLFAPAVVESVKTIVRTPTPGLRLGVASLRRVHIARASTNSVEVFGTYRRGPRVFAVAACLRYRSGKRRSGWTVTSLRVG
ncbi:Rv3235 family protein [Rhodococcus sp. G-MC3]|uniref:Rv3235 family protein n=1 Tax=Rhodococcus sp. G-MC3 TaxID=3046209 RepID=UPI0024BB69C5|nr:Rv3235 family protein [Rhodococcus sp. G-MC3]MDJ0395182.1 Rv3235 family protein [Rhodococcus sp. G-MC3]